MNFFAQGRTAFYHGLLKLKIKKENKILIPDYICKSLLTPIIKLNINYNFYSINDDFTFNFSEIKKKALAKDYLLIVHYFGQPNNINLILKFCKNNNIKLIEDNAHGYSGKFKGTILGTFGEIGFSSPRKILNTDSGGVLFYKKKIISSQLKKYYLSKLATFKNILKKVPLYYYFKNQLYNQSDFYFKRIEKLENSLINYSADINSNNLIKETNWDLISKIRKKRWIKIVKILKKKSCVPVWKSPMSGTCPWLVPFYTKNKLYRDKIIAWGINCGIKIITWPNLPKFNSTKVSENCKLRWERLFCIELDNSIDNLF
jgi:hypothetical protein